MPGKMELRAAEMSSTSLYFGEFYGTQYCNSLTKDLEKFKDEYYDGQGSRFIREWVQPTVDLLRRLQEMGFPIRTQNHIVVHLYNPVDSMAAGEFHFQVGRKAPGKLTLKFTKMAPNCTYMIQPRSLSNAEERKLCTNPHGYLDQVRAEMRSVALDVATIMRVAVLMTDNCQLERCCANILFGYSRRMEPMYSLNTSVSNGDMLMKNNQRMQLTSDNASFNVPSNVPVNVCFKNYVHYGSRDGNPAEAIQVPGGSGTRFNHAAQNSSSPAPYSFNSARPAQLRSEPEEDDETLNTRSQEKPSSAGANHGYGGTAYQMPPPPRSGTSSAHSNLSASPNPTDHKRSPEPYGHPYNSNPAVQVFERSVSNSTANSRSSNESLNQTWHDASPYSRKLSVKTTVLDEYATGNNYNHHSGPSSEEYPPVTQSTLAVETRVTKGRSGSYDAQMTAKAPQNAFQSASSPRTWSVDAYMDSEGSSGDFESGGRSTRTVAVEEYVDHQGPVPNAVVDQCANNGFASHVSRADGRFDSWVSHGDESSIGGSLMIPAPVQELNRTLRQMRLRADNRDN